MAEPRPERPYMPDYGVQASSAWNPLAWSWAAERLVANRNYWVVTASGEGRPHALPVWGVWDDGEGAFAFSCGPHSRKARNIAANPAVVVMTDDTVECVSVEGRAAAVQDDGRTATWIGRYLAKYQPISPELTGEFLSANLLVEVDAERAFGVIERAVEFTTRPTRWVFDERP
ncbi:MAG TPA: pyridoxamine 5'-phosphate oxidase family protein [Acidimicrobiales bacterium]|nr:pyridoxamine 5'-phosphate oxidase family protein [Acidimicrobiales bacterium]